MKTSKFLASVFFALLVSVAPAQSVVNVSAVGAPAAGSDQYLVGASAQTATVNNILTNPAGTAASDVSGVAAASVQVVSTGSGGTFIFESSNDNVNFVTATVYNQTVATGTPITAAITATSSSIIYTFPVTFRYLRLRIATTITGGSIQAFATLKSSAWTEAVFQVAQATAANLNATITGVLTTVTPGVAAANLGKAEDAVAVSGDTGVAVWGIRRDTLVTSTNANGDYGELGTTKYAGQYTFDQEKNLPTYRASTAAGGIALAATATDIAILPGNATNTVYVTKIIISGIQATTGEALINIIKRSTANTVGTSAAMTSVQLDSADGNAVSLPLSYTANPTPGATVGIVDSIYLAVNGITAAQPSYYVFNFGERGKGVKLSGVSQGLAVNLNGVTLTGGNFVITYEWREEP